jgi:hypothetical protein
MFSAFEIESRTFSERGHPDPKLIKGFLMDVKAAIESMNAPALRRLLADDPAQANALISWGEDIGTGQRNLTHPLHYISDVLFADRSRSGSEVELVNALIDAGADVNFQRAPRTDTPLIGASSLGAQDVGLALLEAGARADVPGMFAETALHWAAHEGELRLAAALIPRSDVHAKDEKFGGTPLDWALHGWRDSWTKKPPGGLGQQREVVALLVKAGAKVEAQMLAFEGVQADAGMLAALTGNGAEVSAGG